MPFRRRETCRRRNLPNDCCAWLSRISFDYVAGTVTGPHVPEVVGNYSIRPGAMAQILRLGGTGFGACKLTFSDKPKEGVRRSVE
jgi:hypothetical protein